jgi:hypothetical protein
MRKKRIVYSGLIFLIILLGILSRRIPIVPLCTGDVLWAMMIFFIVRFLFIDARVRSIALVSLSVCYLVEVSQLYQDAWINSIRQTILGGLILGQGFLWGDIVAYAAGILLGFLIEVALNSKRFFIFR